MDDTRILDKLDDISDRMARVETTVDGLSARIDKYNDITGRTSDVEYALQTMRANCERIQGEKKRWRIGPSVVVGILSGVAVGIIMLLVNGGIT